MQGLTRLSPIVCGFLFLAINMAISYDALRKSIPQVFLITQDGGDANAAASRIGRTASLLSVSSIQRTHCGTSTPFISIATKPYLKYSASYLRFFDTIVRIVFHTNVQYNFIDDVNIHRR
ncbi:conserved hypothetical protein [Trichinella spiralis]|uniref:hypothetical protein n=1 Tax=Trichinella spiralis TaxID=6334 RepID=UPI0001EFE83D|nr:conserved hypothetical protein [Trichinella spiralis]XP_003370847.1 conserved hypothetical protein [Trichinella spiralis]